MVPFTLYFEIHYYEKDKVKNKRYEEKKTYILDTVKELSATKTLPTILCGVLKLNRLFFLFFFQKGRILL